MRLLRPLLLTTVALLALTLGAVPPQAQELSRYEVVDLGTLGGERSQANAINDHGQVVGWADTAAQDADGNPIFHAFLWSEDRGIEDLDPVARHFSEAHDINDGSEVVGWSASGPIESFPFHWERRAGMRRLPGTRTTIGEAYGINNRGQVVGTYLAGFGAKALIWRRGRSARPDQLLHGEDGIALELNERGTAVGWIDAGERGAAATRWAPRVRSRAKIVVQADSTAWDIDDAGRIVGESEEGAFIKDGNGLTHLPLLPGTERGAAYSIYQGKIVGSCWRNPSSWPTPQFDLGERASLWRRGRVSDLNGLIPADSGWTLEGAYGINERGQIVGYGLHHGVRRAFLLTPR